ncbi:acetolactate synthase small subunit [Oscillospiraceae bacterium PP1C4]
MKQIISVLVENKAGVLSRTAGLFSRRGFNIESLAVGETEDKSISRMTIVVNGDERTIEQVEKQLNKQIDVIKVKTLAVDTATRRELVLIKVNATQQNRGEVIDIGTIMNAKIVDLSHTTLTIEMCDRPERVDLLLDLLKPYGIAEIARTGMVALQKGSEAIVVKK